MIQVWKLLLLGSTPGQRRPRVIGKGVKKAGESKTRKWEREIKRKGDCKPCKRC